MGIFIHIFTFLGIKQGGFSASQEDSWFHDENDDAISLLKVFFHDIVFDELHL